MSGGVVRTSSTRRHTRNNNASPYARPSTKKSSVRVSMSYPIVVCSQFSPFFTPGMEHYRFP